MVKFKQYMKKGVKDRGGGGGTDVFILAQDPLQGQTETNREEASTNGQIVETLSSEKSKFRRSKV